MRALHAGCGREELPRWFDGWEQVRLDVDERVSPDVVASIIDMGDIGTFDAVFCSHTLEHLYPHEVTKALKEFKRVMNDHAFVLLFVPDLEGISATNDVLFTSVVGDIAGLDLIYGHRVQLEESPFMAHHTGFTKETLEEEIKKAGFKIIKVERAPDHNLFAVAFPEALSPEKAKELEQFFSQPLEDEKCKQH